MLNKYLRNIGLKVRQIISLLGGLAYLCLALLLSHMYMQNIVTQFVLICTCTSSIEFPLLYFIIKD